MMRNVKEVKGKNEENYNNPLKTKFYNLKKMWIVKCKNRICKIESFAR